jgi:3-hydroxyacyl-[acyl-carrier-protein] dehydratase
VQRERRQRGFASEAIRRPAKTFAAPQFRIVHGRWNPQRRGTRKEISVAKDLIIDFSEYDLNHVVAGLDEIRRINPQRFEMEMLTAIVHEDVERKIGVGYKDVRHDEFWIRGHMPGMPIMPGVMICETAAQMCSFLTLKHDLLGVETLGFGGLDEVKFRDPVYPGDRLVMVAQLVKVRRGALVVSRFQGFVGQSLVCEGLIKGVPLPKQSLAGRPAARPG